MRHEIICRGNRNKTVRKSISAGMLCGVNILLLWTGFPESSKAQQAAQQAKTGSSQVRAQNISVLHEDPENALRNGRLFYATSPYSENTLARLGVKSNPFSVTVPLEVDRTNSGIYVTAKIDDRAVHLMLDTGGGPKVALNETAARSIKLQGRVLSSIGGWNGEEPAIKGLAQSLTLGKLKLLAINTFVRHDTHDFHYRCVLGMQIFEKYRVTLDLTAKRMTLSRGGKPVAVPSDGTSLSIPFHYENGLIFVPVSILNQSAWAMLDSGSDGNILSLRMAKLAAAKLALSESASRVLYSKMGTGNTKTGLTVLGLKMPVPISLNAGQDDSRNARLHFSTTSQLGVSSIDDVFNQDNSIPIDVQLGLPFLLQFRRVIIDYPRHILILQGHTHGVPVNMFAHAPDPGTPWPGYQWQRVGDGWVEAPAKTAVNVPSIPLPTAATVGPVSSGGTTTTVDASAGSTVVVNPSGGVTGVLPLSTQSPTPKQTTTTITTAPQAGPGTTFVIINGTKYECPPGSTLRIDADGKTHIMSPTGVNANSQK